jgi:uncharacterized membrane protein YqjE
MEKISETILKFLRLDHFVHNITGYLETQMELLKVEIREDVAKAIARALVSVLLVLIGFMVLVFFSVGLAHYINGFFDKPYAGYWSVAGMYAALFLILVIFRKRIYHYFEGQLSDLIKRKAK